MSVLEIIDASLDRWLAGGLNSIPMPVPADMATGEADDDWRFWKPVRSSVSSAELEQLECDLGVKFSPQYRSVLQHKHFMELHIGEVELFMHPSVGWQEVLKKEVLRGWPRKYLVDKGLLPFASFCDWGMWCFATGEADSTGEYPVYLWDHDSPDAFQFVALSLETALIAERVKGRKPIAR